MEKGRLGTHSDADFGWWHWDKNKLGTGPRSQLILLETVVSTSVRIRVIRAAKVGIRTLLPRRQLPLKSWAPKAPSDKSLSTQPLRRRRSKASVYRLRRKLAACLLYTSPSPRDG